MIPCHMLRGFSSCRGNAFCLYRIIYTGANLRCNGFVITGLYQKAVHTIVNDLCNTFRRRTNDDAAHAHGFQIGNRKSFPDTGHDIKLCFRHMLHHIVMLQLAGKKRGYLLARGEINTERTARVIVDEYRSGKLGRFTLEVPEVQE